EQTILNMLTRQFAPYNIQVVSAAARNMGEVRALLLDNNRVDNPYLIAAHNNTMPPAMPPTPPDPFYNPTNAGNNPGHTPQFFDPTDVDANGAPVHTRDVYVFIGG